MQGRDVKGILTVGFRPRANQQVCRLDIVPASGPMQDRGGAPRDSPQWGPFSATWTVCSAPAVPSRKSIAVFATGNKKCCLGLVRCHRSTDARNRSDKFDGADRRRVYVEEAVAS